MKKTFLNPLAFSSFTCIWRLGPGHETDSVMPLEGDQPSGYERHEQGKWESDTRERGSCVTEVKAGWQSWNRDEPQFPCRSALWSSVAHTDWQGSISQVSEEQRVSTQTHRDIYPHTQPLWFHKHPVSLTQKAIKFALQAWAKTLDCASPDKSDC